MDYNTLIERGLELIPSYLHNEWEEFINKKKNSDDDDAYDICTSVLTYLEEFKDIKSGKLLASSFYEEFSYKSSYSKNLADSIAEFMKYPDNVNFLRAYYESFVDITVYEESALTSRIKELKTRNEIVNLGVNFDEFKDIGKRQKLNIDINGEVTPVIEFLDEVYYGIDDNNEIVLFASLNEYYDLIYLIGNNGCTRLISRQHRLIENGMISDKTIINDENGVRIEGFNIIKNANFFDIRQTVEYIIKLKNKLKDIDSKLIDSLIEEINNTKIKFRNDSMLGDKLFNEMTKNIKESIIPKQQ